MAYEYQTGPMRKGRVTPGTAQNIFDVGAPRRERMAAMGLQEKELAARKEEASAQREFESAEEKERREWEEQMADKGFWKTFWASLTGAGISAAGDVGGGYLAGRRE